MHPCLTLKVRPVHVFPPNMCLFQALTRAAISQRRLQPQRCESLKFRRNKPYISLEVLTKQTKLYCGLAA